MRIYTKTGDKGITSLVGGTRVRKDDARLDAYGTADELNAQVGLLRALVMKCDEAANDRKALELSRIDDMLKEIQNKLFNLGSELADEKRMCADLYIKAEDVEKIEKWIDRLQEETETNNGFILPGGNERVSETHICRTVTRRLEREMVRYFSTEEESEKSALALQFVNRMSDFFFVLSKKMAKIDEIPLFLWEK